MSSRRKKEGEFSRASRDESVIKFADSPLTSEYPITTAAVAVNCRLSRQRPHRSTERTAAIALLPPSSSPFAAITWFSEEASPET